MVLTRFHMSLTIFQPWNIANLISCLIQLSDSLETPPASHKGHKGHVTAVYQCISVSGLMSCFVERTCSDIITSFLVELHSPFNNTSRKGTSFIEECLRRQTLGCQLPRKILNCIQIHCAVQSLEGSGKELKIIHVE